MNLREAVCRPFMDFSQVFHADQLDFYTDGALDDEKLGIGGVFGKSWFLGMQC